MSKTIPGNGAKRPTMKVVKPRAAKPAAEKKPKAEKPAATEKPKKAARPVAPPAPGEKVSIKAANGPKGKTVFLSGDAADLSEALTSALAAGKLSAGADAQAKAWRARLTGVKA